MTSDLDEGRRLRDEGIERTDKAAAEEWKKAADMALLDICMVRPKFTTDAIWALLDKRGVDRPREPRAMAAVLKRGKSLGYCEPTDDPRKPSERPEHHACPLRVWRSLLA